MHDLFHSCFKGTAENLIEAGRRLLAFHIKPGESADMSLVQFHKLVKQVRASGGPSHPLVHADLLTDVFMNAFAHTSYGPASEPRKDVIVSEWMQSRDKSGPKMTLTHLRRLLTESIDMGHLCKSVPTFSEAPNPIRSPNSTPDDPTYAMAASGGGGGGSSVDRRKSEGVKDKSKGSNDRNRTRSPTALTTTKPKGGTLEALYDDISSQGMSVIKTHFPHLIDELTRKVKLCNKLGDKHGVATRFLDAERFQQINQEIREIKGMSTEDRQAWMLFRETGQGKNITFGQLLRKAPTIDEDGKIMKSMSARRHAAAPPQLEAASSKLVGPSQQEASTLKSAMKEQVSAITLMKEKKVSANTKKASVNALKSAPQEPNSPKMVMLDQVTDEVLAEMGISSIHMTPKKIQRLKKSLAKINWADDLDGGSSDEDASDEYEDVSDDE